MRRAATALGLALVLLAPAAAAAPARTMVEYAQSLCMANHGDPDKALALADKEGWKPVPAAALAGLRISSRLEALQVRALDTAPARFLLMLGRGNGPIGAHIRMCAVMSKPPPPGILDRARALAGVPPYAAGVMPTYAWREKNGAHVAISNKDADNALLSHDGSLYFLVARADQQMAMLALMVPVK